MYVVNVLNERLVVSIFISMLIVDRESGFYEFYFFKFMNFTEF